MKTDFEKCMAAIDKIYLKDYDKYTEFKTWCGSQPKLKDKYGKEVSISDYLFPIKKEEWKDNSPVSLFPYYVEAYIIRNCPIEDVQKELMRNWGHWTQEDIKDYYKEVCSWNGEGAYPYWARKEDFILHEDGTMTIDGLDKSEYSRILEGELHAKPCVDYEVGKHFKLPKHLKNRPSSGKWYIKIEVADDLMIYHEGTNTFDFRCEFVSHGGIQSYECVAKTIGTLKRKIRKWKLPVGAIVLATSRTENYKFKITI